VINSGANKNSSQQATTTEVTNIPLAIVGIGCLFPQANSKDNFWANIKGGVDSITDVPETHWRIADLYDPDPKTPDKTYGKRGGFLEPIEFNPLEFSIQPNILEAIDTSQLLGLIAAREALKDAGYDPAGEFARERVSVLLGVTGALEMVIPLGARLGHPYWRKALKDAGIPNDVAQEVVERIADNYVSWQENSFPGLLGNVVAGRISKQFDLGGTNSVIDAACGSSLSAVHMAAMELACGHSDMVITGGIDTFNDIFMYTCFSKTPALSPSNIIRPFDSASDGTLIGEGLGLVVLKRLADAERDKDQIYAVIRGIGTASDGKKGAIYEPNAGGQKKALVSAYQLANIEPSTISLVEAHGTGTRVGDAAEIKALREVYGESTGKPWCALGSVKSQIGHTKASAGSAGLIKMALALYNKVLPPSINVVQPQEVISSGNTPFYVNTTARPWLASQDHPRRAAVSAFGFGGSNFHCVLEEHNAERQGSDWSGAPQIVALSDSDKTGLKQQLQHIAGITSAQLRRFAAQSRAKFDHSAAQRLLFIVEEKQDLAAIVKNAEQLIDAGKTLANTPSGIWYADGVVAGKMAVLFPGQGAQYPGMLVDLACHAPEFIQELQSADKTLQLTEDLSAILYPHSIYTDADQEQAMRKIQATEVAQPAIGTVSLAAWHYLNHFGVQPQAWGGHSYGELTALCAAGCFSATDLYKLSRLRGELMAGDGSDKGTMLAVSAALDKIEQLIADEKLDVVLANRNTPSQGVLSGSRAEIERAALLCKERGLRCVALDVAAAFHSKLVAAAAAPFLQALQQVTVQPAKTTVYANKTASPYPQDSTAMRSVLAEQIASPVEFVQQIENMYAAGITTFVEIGPGARLTGMVGKILKGKEHNALALDSSSGKRSGLNDLARVLIQLAAIGFPVELTKWDEEYAQHQLTLPEPIAPRMTVAICGANYVKHKAKRPASTRKLVDASTISQAAPSATLPSTPATPAAPVTAPLPAHQANPDALRSLQESMTVLQRMQEDTAKLHNKFLEGQAAAIDTMRSLMDHQMGISSAPALSAATVVTPPQSIAAPAPVPPAVTAAVAPTTTAQSTPGADVATSLLEVVAEKTGYPQEMLELDMSLDADLGIDSIKRVEILSAIQEKLPNLPALQPDQLGSLQTLRQIVEAMGSSVASAAVATSAAPAAMAGTADVATSLLEVVAEKTGYPQEMLELDMSLDADLGIDSIKRVEILSAIQEKLPNLPALQPDQLGSLQTLRQIVEAMGSSVASAAVATSAAPAAMAGTADVATSLLEVVAEKTGYPQEMLELDMSLDADLGIDSIKRVEILSAIQEKLPNLPALQPDQLGSLQTLRQIVEAMDSSVASTAVATAAAPAAMAGTADVATSLLEVVAEKTGYPQEMLELDMSLDADLGIDSIKRVEILSAIQEKLPNLPALQPDQLGSLQTLRQIVEAMGSSVASAAVATSAAPAAMAGTADVATSLLEVVAEKTGYPQEMLELDMSLDADLGIDSIKRVEILSAIQEKLPNLPALQPDQLGSLQTLRQIVEAMDGTVISEGATDVEPVAVTKKKITSDPQLHRQILKIVPISTPRAELSLSAQAPIWVVDDCSSTSQLVVTELKKRNYAAELISPTHKTVPEQLSALVVIAPQIGTDSRFLSDSFLLVQRCSSALRHNSANKPSCLMTVSRLDGMAGFDRQALINDPLSGGLAGISKTASHEWPEVQCKAVDLGNDLDESAQATAIINELFTVGPLEVTVNAQGCHTLELQQANLAPSLPRLTLTSNDVVVVSGGARGVTAEVALALAEVGNPTLLLLGRSPEPESEDSWLASAKDEAAIKKALMQHAPHPLKPRELNRACVQVVNNRELTSNINRLQQTGSQVLYRSVDIRDEQAVNIAIAQARKLGTIRGIIHGAGVLADRKIEDKSVEQFDLVYSTKIGGLQALLQATHEDNLDFIGLFSSSTGRFGRTGQLDYAVANEVLNKTAQALARQRSDCRIISFNWGPWDGGMVTPALKRLFASEGISVIDLHAGAQYLLQELANPDDNVEVVILGGSSDDGSDAEKASVTSAETEQPTAKQTLAHALLPNSVLHLSISSKTIPVLRHHVINGKAVVPMALQIEWLAQGAMHNNPGLIFSGFDNLRIRSGIIVPTKSVMEVDLRYGETIVEQNSFIVPMQICSGTDSTIHASADIILTTKLTDQRPNIEPLFIDGGELSSQAEIYSSGHLFHGPQLQGLSQIVGNNNEGIIAISQYAPQPDQWMEKPLRNSWIADPQVLDSSFQMMILWSFAQKQLGSLPSFAGHYRQYCEQFPAGNIRIQCRVTKASQHSASANIDFIDAQTHQLLARMNSYECTMTDNLRQAFINNQLA